MSRLLELDVPLSWQEAVAIVGEVTILRAATPAPAHGHVRIDADSCTLTTGGAIELGRSSVEPAEDAEVQLLRALLAGRDIPEDLEALAYGPTPAHLGDALAVFSRPDRRSAIAAVAVRGLEAEAELAAFVLPDSAATSTAADVLPAPVEGFDELRAQVAHSQEAAASRPPPPPPAARLSRFPSGKVAVAGAVVALGVWAWAAWRPSEPAAAGVAVPVALPAVESRPSWQAAGQRSADIELARPRAGRSVPAAVSAAPDVSPSGSADSTTPDESVSEAWAVIGAPVTPVAAAAPDERSAPGGRPVTAPDFDFADDAVYSRRSAAVQPPSMRFPRMPRSAFPAADAVIEGQYIEVLVDRAGAVEAVRLRGRPLPGQPGLRYGMLLAAAKVWQFRPATLDGTPVRYVTRMVLDP